MSTSTFSRSTFSSSDQTLIALDSRGAGPGLVILPGAVVPAERYQSLATLLSRSFTVHLMHRRGHGASGPQGSDHSMDHECDDVLAALELTGASRIFGHSYGGLVAIETALRDTRRSAGKRRLAHVVTYDPAATVFSAPPTGFLPRFEAELARHRHAAALTTMQRGLRVGGPLDRMPRRFAHALNWAILHAPGGPATADNLHSVPGEAKAAAKIEEAAHAYASVTTPILIMVGARSPQWLQQAGRELANTLQHTRLATITNLDHNGPLLRPEAVVRQLERSQHEHFPTI
jgi:pimeloyl-ACP methyl ester carboxylesterase